MGGFGDGGGGSEDNGASGGGGGYSWGVAVSTQRKPKREEVRTVMVRVVLV